MTSEQFAQLLQALEKLAVKPYTITGASDWPMLLVIGGMMLAIISAMSGAFWHYVLMQLGEHKKENEKDIDTLFEVQRRCQDECCPRGNKTQRQ
jgi:hypothetical protein